MEICCVYECNNSCNNPRQTQWQQQQQQHEHFPIIFTYKTHRQHNKIFINCFQHRRLLARTRHIKWNCEWAKRENERREGKERQLTALHFPRPLLNLLFGQLAATCVCVCQGNGKIWMQTHSCSLYILVISDPLPSSALWPHLMASFQRNLFGFSSSVCLSVCVLCRLWVLWVQNEF